MNHLVVENLAVVLCAAAGFLYGARLYLRPKKPLYASMIVLGLGCLMLGRLYQCVRLLTGSEITVSFQIGVLGIVGAFSFFFSANYGLIDSLVDDGSPAFARYRRIAWAGPALIALFYLPVVFSPIAAAGKVICTVVAVFIGLACYFHVKHLVIPDVDYGVVKCLRHYNALALALGAVSMLEMAALAWEIDWLVALVTILLCVISLAMVPVLDRGVKAWQA